MHCERFVRSPLWRSGNFNFAALAEDRHFEPRTIMFCRIIVSVQQAGHDVPERSRVGAIERFIEPDRGTVSNIELFERGQHVTNRRLLYLDMKRCGVAY